MSGLLAVAQAVDLLIIVLWGDLAQANFAQSRLRHSASNLDLSPEHRGLGPEKKAAANVMSQFKLASICLFLMFAKPMLAHSDIKLEPYKISLKADERFVVPDPEALVEGGYIYVFDGFRWENANLIEANPDLLKAILESGGATTMESLISTYLSLFSDISSLKANLLSLYSPDSNANIERLLQSPGTLEKLLLTFERLKGLTPRFVYKISSDEFVVLSEPSWKEGQTGVKLLPFLIKETNGRYVLVAGNITRTPKWQNILSAFMEFGIGEEILERVGP